jgi:hypothetical protein
MADDDPTLSDDQLLAQRAMWFEAYTARLNVCAPRSDSNYAWSCCGHPTLTERGPDASSLRESGRVGRAHGVRVAFAGQ